MGAFRGAFIVVPVLIILSPLGNVFFITLYHHAKNTALLIVLPGSFRLIISILLDRSLRSTVLIFLHLACSVFGRRCLLCSSLTVGTVWLGRRLAVLGTRIWLLGQRRHTDKRHACAKQESSQKCHCDR